MLGNLLESILKFLLLLGRTLKVGLFLCIGILRRILKRLLGLWRRVFEHRERIISVAHRFTLFFFQNVLLVGLRTDQIFQRLDLRIELLLLGELRCGGIGLLRLRLRFGFFLNLFLLLRESCGEFRDGRRELLHPLACFVHLGAE